MFDFIYIDASHVACDALLDAVLSWNLLKEDGIMIFDDYDSDLYKEEFFNTKIAVDSFLRCYKQHIKVIEKYYQMAIRKVKPTTTFEMILCSYLNFISM
ncbi:5361_t:CDS:2 [Entrophospora sp. SA101]|nr:5361_t:CDS:2 [Entrophospora sp. SA101]